MSDLIVAARGLSRRPLFTIAPVLLLAIGIGASTAVFSVVNGLLLTPLPYPEPDRLVRVHKSQLARDMTHIPLTYPELEYWTEASQSIESAAAIGAWGVNDAAMTLDGRARHVSLVPVSSSFFDVLGVAALHGRTFDADDDGASDEPALVLSYELWQRGFGADPAIVGTSVRLLYGKEHFRVVGVLPEGVAYPAEAEAYVVGIGVYPDWAESRWFECDLVARLAPGVELDPARAELAVVYEGLARERPDLYRAGMEIVVAPLLETVVGDIDSALWFLLGAVALVLAVAAANVSGLLLARGTERRQELAVRIALGAGRARILKLVLAETLLLAVAGGVLSLLLAEWGVRLLLAIRPDALPRADEIGLDPKVLLFSIAATTLAALGAGLLPAWRASHADASRFLTRRWFSNARAMRALVVGELTLALVLAVGAALVGKSFAGILAIDRGLPEAELSIVSLQLSSTGRERFDLIDRLLESVGAIPGVMGATTAHGAPAAGPPSTRGAIFVEGQTEDEAERNPWIVFDAVPESYFDTLGLPLLEGRGFRGTDRRIEGKIAIVSESLARFAWPNERPVGKRFRFGTTTPWLTVVGVSADARYHDVDADWLAVYFPLEQSSFSDQEQLGWYVPRHLVVRSRLPAATLAPLVRERIHAVAPDIPVERVEAFEVFASKELARPRFHTVTLGLFAAVALLLAFIGVYAVMSVNVNQRRAEIGLRLALGATPGQAVGAVFKSGLAMCLAGTGLGLVVALAASRLLASFLYEVSPFDAASFATAGAALLTAGLGASYLPARRAARVHPSVTLRHE